MLHQLLQMGGSHIDFENSEQLQQQILNLLDNPQLCKKSQIKVSKVTTA
jgi:hypothetical protein